MSGIDSNALVVCHFNGTNGSTSIVDSSQYNRSITAGAYLKQTTADKIFGTASLEMLYPASYAAISPSSLWNIFTSAFTVDFWIKVNFSAIQYPDVPILTTVDDDKTSGFSFIVSPANGQISCQFTDDVNNESIFFYCSNSGIVTNTWQHVAIVHNGTNNYIFVDGTSVTLEYSDGQSSYSFTPDNDIHINGDGVLGANIDELRVSSVARWTSNFTTPVSEYSSDDNTVLLMHFNGNFTDSSSHNQTVTATLDATTSSSSPKFGSASYVNPVNNTAYIPFSTDFNMWMGQATIDFRVLLYDNPYSVDEFVGGVILAQNDCSINHDNDSGFMVAVYANTAYFSGSNSSGGFEQLYTAVDFNFELNTWYHIAFVFADDTIRVYVDGKLYESSYVINELTRTFDSTRPYSINQLFNGKIDELRISNIARWPAPFTVPLEEYSTGDSCGLYATTEFPVFSMTAYQTPPVTGDMILSAVPITLYILENVSKIIVVAQLPILRMRDIDMSVDGNFLGISEVCEMSAMGAVSSVGSLTLLELPCSFTSNGAVSSLGYLTTEFFNCTVVVQGTSGNVGVFSAESLAVNLYSLGIVSNLGSMTVTEVLHTVFISGSVNNIGSLALLCDYCSTYFSGRTDVTGKMVMTLQPGNVNILSSFDVNRTVYCLNLMKKGLISQFINYDYLSFTVINGSSLGAKNSGLYSLTGSNSVNAKITFPLSKFETELIKQVRSVRVFARNSNSKLLITINDDNGNSWEKSINTLDSNTANGTIVNFPFTTKGRYLQVTVENTDGGDFSLDQLDIFFYILGR